MKRSSSATTAVARSSSPENETTLAVLVRQLALERFYVLLVGFDAVLERLQALEHSRVVALVAGAHAFLLGELLLRLGEIGFLAGELLLEDLALLALGVRPIGRRFSREAVLSLLGRRRHVDLGRDELALAAGGFTRIVRVARTPRSVDALVDLAALLRRGRERSQCEHAENQQPKYHGGAIYRKRRGGHMPAPSSTCEAQNRLRGVVHLEFDRMGRHAET